MSDTIQGALLFLVNTLFNLYLFVLIVRAILVWIGANYHEPITQVIVKLTQFIIKPLQGLIPNFRRVECATLLVILLMEMLKFLLISVISYGFPNISGLILLAVGDTLKWLLQIFFYAIVLQAIMSWIQPMSPINYTLQRFTSPIMQPIQRIIPPIGGIDITPIPALIILQLLSMLLVSPMMAMGLSIALT